LHESDTYSRHGRLSVYLSVSADPDVRWGMVGVPFGCALLGRFEVSERVSLL